MRTEKEIQERFNGCAAALRRMAENDIRKYGQYGPSAQFLESECDLLSWILGDYKVGGGVVTAEDVEKWKLAEVPSDPTE